MTYTNDPDDFDSTELVDIDVPEETPARDDEWAARTMRIVRAIDRRITRIDAQRAAHIAAAKAEAEEYERDLYNALVYRVEGLRNALEAWGIEQREAHPNAAASIPFPAGVIKTRRVTHWNWPDDADLLVALGDIDRPDLIRTKQSPAKDGIKAEALVKDGIVVLAGQVLKGVSVDENAIVAEVKVA